MPIAQTCGPLAHVYLWGCREIGVGYVGQERNTRGLDRILGRCGDHWRGDGYTRDLNQHLANKGFTPKFYVLECLPYATRKELGAAEAAAMRRCTENGILLWNKERQDRAKPSETFTLCFDHDRDLALARIYSEDQPKFSWVPDLSGECEEALQYLLRSYFTDLRNHAINKHGLGYTRGQLLGMNYFVQSKFHPEIRESRTTTEAREEFLERIRH